jgi:hypothetical protein
MLHRINSSKPPEDRWAARLSRAPFLEHVKRLYGFPDHESPLVLGKLHLNGKVAALAQLVFRADQVIPETKREFDAIYLPKPGADFHGDITPRRGEGRTVYDSVDPRGWFPISTKWPGRKELEYCIDRIACCLPVDERRGWVIQVRTLPGTNKLGEQRLRLAVTAHKQLAAYRHYLPVPAQGAKTGKVTPLSKRRVRHG